VLVDVDDMTVTSSNTTQMTDKLKQFLNTEFHMTWSLKYFLGLEILIFFEGIFVYQREYVRAFLEEIGMT